MQVARAFVSHALAPLRAVALAVALAAAVAVALAWAQFHEAGFWTMRNGVVAVVVVVVLVRPLEKHLG